MKPVSRRPEKWISGIGLALAGLLQGGFTLTVNASSEAEFDEKILPAMQAAGIQPTGDAYEGARTLAGWFGFSLIVVLALCAVGLFSAAPRPARRSTGWWFAGAGLICLVGTQFILYPVAFFFFLTAALFAVRSTQQGSSS
jgi:hypothetical protein